MRIIVLGLFGSPNHGNEATLAAFESNMRLRLPDLEIACVAPKQSNISATMGMQLIKMDPMPVGPHLWRVRPAQLRSSLEDFATRVSEPFRMRFASKLLAGSSALIIPGTGLIDDFGQGPMDMPTHLARWTRAADRLGVPVLFLSVGVSRVEHPTSRRLFLETISRSTFASCRDEVSAINARNLGSDVKFRVVPDLAFSMPREWTTQPRGAARETGTIGVGVMGYVGWNKRPAEGQAIYQAYLDNVVALVTCIIRRGRSVRLITGDARSDDSTVVEIARRCASLSGSQRLLIAEPIRTFHDVLSQLSACDAVVASRFHNVLFSIMLKKPVISIGYGDKNTALMSYFGMSEYSRNIDSFDAQEVGGLVVDLSDRQVVENSVTAQLERVRELLSDQYDMVCEMLTGVSGQVAQ